MSYSKNEIGKKYGKLTVIGESDKRTKSGAMYWKCSCECGNIKDITGTLLRNGQSRSCGCNNGGVSNVDGAYRFLYKSIKSGAISRNLTFNISFETFKNIVHENCYICGESPKDIHYAYNRRRYSKGIEFDISVVCNGLDRVDNSIGYELYNVKSCCFKCNRLKSDLSLNEFIEHINKIYKKWNENWQVLEK
jgi:hypothetical protein